MNALVRKEIRLLLPAWIAAMSLATLPSVLLSSMGATFHSDIGIFYYGPFGLGVLLLGLSSFGQEFSSGTFSILLAQPIPRIQIWRLKIKLLAASLLLVWVTLFAALVWGHMSWVDDGWMSDPLIVITLIMVTVYSSVLWTTLLFRQVSAAFWFTILVPAFLATFTWSFWQKQHSEMAAFVVVSLILLTYSIAGFFWARWMFLRAQDTAWTGGNISMPSWLGFKTQASSTVAVPKLKPLRALLRKEFQSHHITLLIAALLLVSHLVGIAVRKLEYDPTNPHKAAFEIFGFWWLLWFALPLIIGSTTVAEERKLGTLEGQLCLPVKRGVQFIVKFLVALLLGIFLGGVMPGLCEGVAMWAGVPGEFPTLKSPDFMMWMTVCCLIATGITLASIYASTLTRNLLQSLGTAVVTGMGLGAFGMFLVVQENLETPLWTGPLGIYVGLPVMIATLIWLAFKNFKTLQVGQRLWLRNGFTVLAAMIFAVAVTTVLWNRVWEPLMTLEPSHGPARLSGEVRPGISVVWGGKLFALLPDGRVWVENKFQILETGEFETSRGNGEEQTRPVRIPIPVGGTFLEASNWIQLVEDYSGVIGLKSDGSLWNIFRPNTTNYLANLSSPPQLEHIGADSDWKTVISGRGGLFALKQDGSLWNSDYRSKEFRRFGHDSDWATLFTSRNSVTGVKRDGSVWKWGHLSTGPNGWEKDWKEEHREPVPWNLNGADWVAFDDNFRFNLAVKRDGTAWASGYLPNDLLGHFFRDWRGTDHLVIQPKQIGAESDWADVKTQWNSLLALKKTGAVYHNYIYGRYPAWSGSLQKLSPHSDWIAIAYSDETTAGVALAADGTLSAWENPLRHSNHLLGPSHKPLWTLNIFAEAK